LTISWTPNGKYYSWFLRNFSATWIRVLLMWWVGKSASYKYNYTTWCVYRDNWAQVNTVLHKSLLSLCVSVCVSPLWNGMVKCISPFIATQRLGKHVPVAKNTCNARRGVGRVFFYAVRVL
jgi:hypothetical protein